MIGYSSPFGIRSAPVAAPVVVYGTRWCAATQLVRRRLDRLGIPYRCVDLDLDPGGRAPARLADQRLREPPDGVGRR